MPPSLARISAQLIDEYGELLRRKSEAEVRVAIELGLDPVRLEAIEAELKAHYVSHPAGQPAVDEGIQYFLEVTPCEFRRELPIKAKRKIFTLLKAKLGVDPLGLFSVTQETVKGNLGSAAVDEYYAKERTGPRKFKVVAKAPPAAIAKKAA